MDFLKIIDEYIEKQHKEDDRRYIGASLIGNPCMRYVWNSIRGVEKNALTAKQIRTFKVGKLLEEMILNDIENAGFKITRNVECIDNDNILFKGHCDAILHINESNDCILELKTAKASEFKKFNDKGIKEWNMQYYYQCQSYMGMKKLKYCLFIVINKDNADMACEYIYFDEICYAELQAKASNVLKLESEPARINDNPCFWICQMCAFKVTCHKPAGSDA